MLYQKQQAEIRFDNSKVWFRPQQQRPLKTTEKILRCRIAWISVGRFNSYPKKIGRSIRSWPGNYFQTFTSHSKDPERRKIGAVYELKERDIERRKTTYKILLVQSKWKSFLYRIVTGDEKWIYFNNLERKKWWVDSGQLSTSQLVRNIHGKKGLLCIRWNQKGTV